MASEIDFTWGTVPFGTLSEDVTLGTVGSIYGNGNTLTNIISNGISATSIQAPYWGDGITSSPTSAGTNVLTPFGVITPRYLQGATALEYLTLFIGSKGTHGLGQIVDLTFSVGSGSAFNIAGISGTENGYTVNRVNGNTLRITIADATISQTFCLWISLDGSSDGISFNRVTIVETFSPQFNIQALNFGNQPVPNCFSGTTMIKTAADSFVPIQDLKSGIELQCIAPDGSIDTVKVAIVRFRTLPLGRCVQITDTIAVSPSHVLLMRGDEVDAQRKDVEEWACGDCKAAESYGANSCSRCAPIEIKDYACVAACDLKEGTYISVPMCTMYHVVPLDYADAHKAIVLKNGMLSEMFRTPLHQVLSNYPVTKVEE